MNKRIKRGLASIALTSLVLAMALISGTVYAEQGKAIRIGETDRYATAAKIATTNWATSDNVVLVSGEGYADAISATVLAKKLNSPILLTASGTLNADTKAALTNLKTKNVYVVGGNASINQSIRDELKSNNYNLIELQGSNRYETNIAVAKKLVDLGVKADNIMLVGGEGFSDALSVAPIASSKEQILLLGSNDDDSMKSAIEFIKYNNSKVTVLGTKNVINEHIYNSLGAIERIDGGADRFETNMNVLTKFGLDLKDGQVFVANASGQGYADALVAAALAGKSAAPLVLIDTPSSKATTKALDYIKGKASKVTGINIVGGVGVISKDIEDAINLSIGNEEQVQAVEQPAVKSIYPINLNQIGIEFNAMTELYSTTDVTNYEINGSKLVPCTGGVAKESNAATIFYEDPYHAFITLAQPRKQYDKLTVKVKTGILTFDETKTIEGLSKDITVSDTEAPKLTKVAVEGNNRLRVEFSEAVNIKTLNEIKSKFKIDGESLSNYGVNSAYTQTIDMMTVDDSLYGPVGTWADKILFYLDRPISTGTHTLKVLDGDNNGALRDVAGFIFKESSSDFKVESSSTAPVIKSIVHTEGGRIYITFDKSMDVKSGTDLSNYELNGKKLSEMPGAVYCYLDEPVHDVLKVFNIPENMFHIGVNIVNISDKIKDAYGNKVASNTSTTFNNAKDNTKPTVNSVKILDRETIRVEYSKVVDFSYATNISNYKLLDNEGINITNHIKTIVSSSDPGNNNCFDIKLNKYNPDDAKDDWRLNSSKYTLTIKNMVDTATKPNRMDDYTTTLDCNDDISPKVTGVYANLSNALDKEDKVVIYFSEAMDLNTITNKDNYKFINGEGETEDLPESVTISSGGDDKSAIIEFPSNYDVKTTGTTIIDETTDITEVIVLNVKDKKGNTLDGEVYRGSINKSEVGAQVKANTLRVYYDGDDLKADFQFDKAIDEIEVNDFTLGGVKPSSVDFSGNKVTLIFNDEDEATDAEKADHPVGYANGLSNDTPTKVEVIKAQGQEAYLGIKVNAATTDETGAAIASLDDKSENKENTIYYYQAEPRTTCSDDNGVDFWTATKGVDGGKVYVTFDTIIDLDSAIDPDDFTFNSIDGTDIKADSVKIKGNTIVFNFNNTNENYSAFTNSLDVRIKNSISLRTDKDADGNYVKYTPSKDDLKSRTVIITDK
ncbi:cell wall-binding repeat-containing protein [Clostridium sp. A1-XYC3]|uniref:Cell wall-binding repeat-containing protein n=1 Tax=Clostridium tanneri TaxID=3037988 RepID=A0ABU4JW08_9CLOT|nr:cell wall-binding repeat-containing protein [Clostridium sp. A1-XYC3]MDW8802345.1 cell wall-binding repeat-containing protein [Clostridium sp. A1-XYC3]